MELPLEHSRRNGSRGNESSGAFAIKTMAGQPARNREPSGSSSLAAKERSGKENRAAGGGGQLDLSGEGKRRSARAATSARRGPAAAPAERGCAPIDMGCTRRKSAAGAAPSRCQQRRLLSPGRRAAIVLAAEPAHPRYGRFISRTSRHPARRLAPTQRLFSGARPRDRERR